MTDVYDPVNPNASAADLDALTDRVMARLEARLQPLFNEHIEQGKRQLAFDLRSQFAALGMSAAGELLRLRKDHRQALAELFAEERETWRVALVDERDGQVRALREETVTAAEDALAVVAAQWLNESRAHLEHEAETQTTRLAEQLMQQATLQLQTRLDELLATQQQTLTTTLATLAKQQFAAQREQISADFDEQIKRVTHDSLTLIRDSVRAEGGGLLWELQERLEKALSETRDALLAQFAESAQCTAEQFGQQLRERQAAATEALESLWYEQIEQRRQQFGEELTAVCAQQVDMAMQPPRAALVAESERLRDMLAENAQADFAVHAQAAAEQLKDELAATAHTAVQERLATWRGELDATLTALAERLDTLGATTVTPERLNTELDTLQTALAAAQTQLASLSEQLGRLAQSTKSVVQRVQSQMQERLTTLQEDTGMLSDQHSQFAELIQQLAAAQEMQAAFMQWYCTASPSARLLGRYQNPV